MLCCQITKRLISDGFDVELLQEDHDFVEGVSHLRVVEIRFLSLFDVLHQMPDAVSRQQRVMAFCELCKELNVGFVGEVGVIELIDPQLKDLLILFYFLDKSLFKCGVDRCYLFFEQVDGKTVVFGLVNEGLELLKIERDMVDRL